MTRSPEVDAASGGRLVARVGAELDGAALGDGLAARASATTNTLVPRSSRTTASAGPRYVLEHVARDLEADDHDGLSERSAFSTAISMGNVRTGRVDGACRRR